MVAQKEHKTELTMDPPMGKQTVEKKEKQSAAWLVSYLVDGWVHSKDR
jgi:hypothetical protein